MKASDLLLIVEIEGDTYFQPSATIGLIKEPEEQALGLLVNDLIDQGHTFQFPIRAKVFNVPQFTLAEYTLDLQPRAVVIGRY